MNLAWKHIFNEYNILKELQTKKWITINANDIKECKKTYKSEKKNQFEPRLLCYQTTEKERPLIFKENNLYILPIKNGKYMLTKQNLFFKLKYDFENIIKIKKDNGSILSKFGESESNIISDLKNSKLFESPKYFNEKIKYVMPIHGRHYCSFEMNIDNVNINISGVQYELDGSFESENKIMLIECKKSNKKLDSFNIRQLYFPFRVIYDLMEKDKDKKEILILYIHNLNNLINIWKFKFNDYKDLNSIECIDYNCYEFVNEIINDTQ